MILKEEVFLVHLYAPSTILRIDKQLRISGATSTCNLGNVVKVANGYISNYLIYNNECVRADCASQRFAPTPAMLVAQQRPLYLQPNHMPDRNKRMN